MAGPAGARFSGGAAEPPARERLAAEMRGLKTRSQLSYGRLAERTHYSRSSWERFLNGKQLPSRGAVREFAEATGSKDPGFLVALQEAALREAVLREAAPREGAQVEARAFVAPPFAAPYGPRPRGLVAMGGAGAGAVVGSVATAVLLVCVHRVRVRSGGS
ncbi:helix-turn-helix domain-containing protein [Streptomyces sp. NBC_01264]|uniref:helix-turn-helix domain-containing protein n=1 Tax=Streptomyces sp. NBC_01264 TaxID=2903804 RepID=UPI00224F1E40|nr:helix-turn-helix transcriptional regulator [Streptomyces sp. NBC_01264]MCX4779935.1 helix-turn-helix domain-containing protein [Streptomyces sp. NBC_01264]